MEYASPIQVNIYLNSMLPTRVDLLMVTPFGFQCLFNGIKWFNHEYA